VPDRWTSSTITSSPAHCACARVRNLESCITARCVTLAKPTRGNASSFARPPGRQRGAAHTVGRPPQKTSQARPVGSASVSLILQLFRLGIVTERAKGTRAHHALVACRVRPALASETKHVINSISTNAFVCFSLARRRERETRLPLPGASLHDRYLVDPASSHMLVSKIKPCMSKYNRIYTGKLRMAH
jgi:hypothetical protein